MQHYAFARVHEDATAFFVELMTFWRARDMLTLDETAKDNNALRA